MESLLARAVSRLVYVPRSDGGAVRPVVVCTAYASRAALVPTTTGPTAEPSDRGTYTNRETAVGPVD